MSNITKDQVIEWLSAQSVLDIANLVKDLETKWGVSAAAPVAVAVAGGAAVGYLGHPYQRLAGRPHPARDGWL